MITLSLKHKQEKAVVIIGLLLLPVVAIMAYHLAYRNKIYPQVKVAGIDLSNTSLAQAESRLDEVATRAFFDQPGIQLTYSGNEWNILKAEIGFVYNPRESAEKAMAIGRSGAVVDDFKTKWHAWFEAVDLPIDYSFNQKLLEDKVASIAADLGVPVVPPTIELLERPDKNGSWVRLREGESGLRLQGDQLIETVTGQLRMMINEPIVLPVETVVVDVTEEQMQATTMRAEKLVKRKLVLSNGEQTWAIEGEELLNLIDFHGGFTTTKIHDYVQNLSKLINRSPQNAAFQFNEGRVTEFRPAKEGLVLQQEVAVKDIVEALAQLESGDKEAAEVSLAMERTGPEITLADVNNLGIAQLVGKGTSTYKGSIPGRVHNVGLSASRINGVLVKPGETFSFNAAVGEISGATGYQPAYVIRSGATVLDDGGGVCQTSSTLFRAILDAGLPIVERKAHSYRVGYYEQNAKAGLDATVFAPTADLKFLNDTPGHLLIQTQANAASQSLIIEIYGTSDGRVAEITNHKIWDIVPAPPPRYQDDPSIPAGVTKQVDWAAKGAKAKFDYTVKRNGEVIFTKTFLSVYRPWQAVYLKGTGG